MTTTCQKGSEIELSKWWETCAQDYYSSRVSGRASLPPLNTGHFGKGSGRKQGHREGSRGHGSRVKEVKAPGRETGMASGQGDSSVSKLRCRHTPTAAASGKLPAAEHHSVHAGASVAWKAELVKT